MWWLVVCGGWSGVVLSPVLQTNAQLAFICVYFIRDALSPDMKFRLAVLDLNRARRAVTLY